MGPSIWEMSDQLVTTDTTGGPQADAVDTITPSIASRPSFGLEWSVGTAGGRLTLRCAALLLLLVLGAGTVQAGARLDCQRACGERIAACWTASAEFGAVLVGACRKAVLKQCVREGVTSCEAVTTTTSTSAPSTCPQSTTTTTQAVRDCGVVGETCAAGGGICAIHIGGGTPEHVCIYQGMCFAGACQNDSVCEGTSGLTMCAHDPILNRTLCCGVRP